jgi:hypothetical protein
MAGRGEQDDQQRQPYPQLRPTAQVAQVYVAWIFMPLGGLGRAVHHAVTRSLNATSL